MIIHLELKNFTAFSDLSIAFSVWISSIIGANSTRKEQLQKVSYVFYTCGPKFKNMSDIFDEELESAMTNRLLSLLMPLDCNHGELHHKKPSGQACLEVELKDGQKIGTTFSKNSWSSIIQDGGDYQHFNAVAVKSRMNHSLKRELPVSIASRLWHRVFATSGQVVDIDKLNETLPNWPVTRIGPNFAGGTLQL